MDLLHLNPTTCLCLLKMLSEYACPRPKVRYLTMVMAEGSYLSSLTPMTNIGASGEGADTTTRLAPPWRWDCGQEREGTQVRNRTLWQTVYMLCTVYACVCVHTEAFSTLRKTPVDSTTYKAPALPHGISFGFILESESQSQIKWFSLLFSNVKLRGKAQVTENTTKVEQTRESEQVSCSEREVKW